MIHYDWLAHHMHHCQTYAAWLYRQFQYEYASQSLAEWQAEFAEGQLNGRWPCLIALNDDQLLGGAALAKDDLPDRPEPGPWLACVLVTPQARGQGITQQLIEGICARAKDNGAEHLYLHTHDRSDYYAQRGWRVLEHFIAWGEQQTLMSKPL